jgi:imidazolonepropionase-like amidohydrolase
LYVKAGIPSAKVLQIATSGAAAVAGKSGEWGVIKPGRKADLILVDGNPVDHISDIRKTVLVIRKNESYDPAKLYGALSIKPYTAK